MRQISLLQEFINAQKKCLKYKEVTNKLNCIMVLENKENDALRNAEIV